jgi:hypothetical protein
VIRNNRQWPLVAAIGAVFLVQGILNTGSGLRVFFLVVGVLALAHAVWTRLVVTPDGLVVVNLLPHRLAWSDITSVDAPSRWGTSTLVLGTSAGGRPVRSWAVRGASSGVLSSREWVEASAQELAAEWRRKTGAAAG